MTAKKSSKAPAAAALAPLREQIDALDQQLLAAINRRAAVALQIGEIKHRLGLPVYDPDREARVLANLRAKNPGPLSETAITAIYSQIIKACRSIEQPPRVAFLGPAGTFSHQAALDYFGPESEGRPLPDFPDVAEAVARGEVNAGVLPVENSTEGFIGTTFDLVVEHDLAVIGEIVVPVELYLIANCKLSEVKVVYSHAQPLRQARKWLRANVGDAAQIAVESTAAAAERAAAEKHAAAVVGPLTLGNSKLPVLAGPIADRPNNRTRFWVIGREPSKQGDKSALMLVLPHEPGTLSKALGVFAKAGLNLTQIASRPDPVKPWEYRFFVELEANAYREPAKTVLRKLGAVGIHVRLLGVFAPAEPI